jgi:hypothetical protein
MPCPRRSVTESFALPPDQRYSNMPDYRAYIIGTDGKVQESVPLDCADDDVAMLKAKQLVDGHHVELWQRTRKIARFGPRTSPLQHIFRA